MANLQMKGKSPQISFCEILETEYIKIVKDETVQQLSFEWPQVLNHIKWINEPELENRSSLSLPVASVSR